MPFQNIQVLLTGNSVGLDRTLDHASRQVDRFGREVNGVRRGVIEAGSALKSGLAAGAAAVAAGFAFAATEAIQFEKRMRNVNSLAKLNETGFQDLSAAVIQMSRETGQSANTLAEGLYDITSSGFAGADAMTILRASADAASAGLTTTEVSAKAVTAVLNAYKKPASEAADVSDILFQTVNMGVMTFDELASNIGDYIGTAQALGVSFEETGAATATMTLNGINAAGAGTALNGVLQKLIVPSDKMRETLKAQGYESGTAAVKALGLKGTLELLARATGGSAESMQALFPDIEALRGALALTANGGSKYNEVFNQIVPQNERAGATAATLAEQMKSTAAQLNMARRAVEATAIEIGMRLLPVLNELIQGAMGAGGALKDGIGMAASYLRPVMENLGDIIGDLWNLLEDLGRVVAPVAAGFIAVGVAVGGMGLEAITGVLSSITGFFADNEAAAATLAVAVGILSGAFTRAGVAMAMMVITPVLKAFYAVQTAIYAITGATAGLTIATAAATAGISLLVGAAVLGWQQYKEGTDRASDALKAFGGASAGGLQQQIDGVLKLNSEYDSMRARLEDLDKQGFFRGLGDDLERAGLQRKIGEVGAASDAARVQLEDLHNSVVVYFSTKLPPDEMQARFGSQEARARSLAEVMPVLEAAGVRLGDSQQEVARKMGEYTAKQEAAANGAPALGKALTELKAPHEISAEAAEAHKKKIEELASTLDQFADPVTAYKGVLDKKTEKEREAAEKTAAATKSGKDSWKDYAKEVKVSLNEVAEALEKQIQDQVNWEGNIVKVAERAGADVAQQLREMGTEGIALTAAMATGTDKEVQRMARALRSESRKGSQDAAREVDEGMQLASVKGRQGARATVESVATEMGKTPEEVRRIAKRWNVKLDEGMDESERKGKAGGEKTAKGINDKLASGLPRAGRIATGYANQLVDGLNPVLEGVGGKQIPRSKGTGGRTDVANGAVMDFYGKGGLRKENHVAQIAPAGTWRVWAEPETGGEAYIPLAPAKRQRSIDIWKETGKRLGTWEEFAKGGFWDPNDVPKPPSMRPFKRIVAESGDATMNHGYVKTRDWVDKNAFDPDTFAPGKDPGGGKRTRKYGGVLASVAAVGDHIQDKFGGMTVGGYANRNIGGTNTKSDHAKGKALDFMTYRNKSKGDAIARYLVSNARKMRSDNVIWYRRIWSASRGSWKGYSGQSPHTDHVHYDTFREGGIRLPKLHKGGYVDSNWPSQKYLGLRSDERAAVLQTGERVVPRGIGRQVRELAGEGGVTREDIQALVAAIRSSAPAIGNLTVQHTSERASAASIVDEAMHQARVARMGGRR